MNARFVGPQRLATELMGCGPLMLIIDFDGTLATIVNEPDDAVLAPGAADALRALIPTVPVAVLSGRDLDDLVPRLAGIACHIAGNHGARITTADGNSVELIDTSAAEPALHTVVDDIARLLGDGDGWSIERKSSSIAIHYRQVPDAQSRDVLPKLAALLASHANDTPGFDVLHGKAVIEFRLAGVHKGTAVDWLVERYPGFLPVTLGDDVTDEDAFAVAREHGGRAIIVGDSQHDTCATDRLAGPKDVVTMLRNLADVNVKA